MVIFLGTAETKMREKRLEGNKDVRDINDARDLHDVQLCVGDDSMACSSMLGVLLL